jgi:hypothetical protein
MIRETIKAHLPQDLQGSFEKTATFMVREDGYIEFGVEYTDHPSWGCVFTLSVEQAETVLAHLDAALSFFRTEEETEE